MAFVKNKKDMNTLSVARLDKKYVWHPFTQMSEWEKEIPLVVDSGKGVYLKDTDGKKYIDGVSSLWVNVHGHRRAEIDKAIKFQLSRVAHSTFLGLTHIPAVELARRLVDIAPSKNLKKVFYSDNGSTAVEVALKMAFQYWRQKKNFAGDLSGKNRCKFLSLKNAYHGDTVGSVSVGGMEVFHSIFKPLLFDAVFAPSPYCYRCPHRAGGAGTDNKKFFLKKYNPAFRRHCNSVGCDGWCVGALENIVKKNSSSLAAAIIEPMIQGAAGMIVMPRGYVKEFERVCRSSGILIIADEVATGFGRTGRMFASEIEGLAPDFLCMAKGITGGYLPLAATLTTEKIFKAFLGKYEEYKTFFHGHTYTANPLACAAAVANLDIFEKEKTLEHLQAKINFLSSQLAAKLKGNLFTGEIRQLGLMAGIELVRDKNTAEPFSPSERVGYKVCKRARKYGVILRPLGDVIVIMPPLAVGFKEIEKIVDAVAASIKDVLYF